MTSQDLDEAQDAVKEKAPADRQPARASSPDAARSDRSAAAHATGKRPADSDSSLGTVALGVRAATRIGRYQVLRKLGEGGMGVVLLAYDEELDRKVAVKLLQEQHGRGPEQRLRILREAQAMARISHQNVVHVYEVGEHKTHSTSQPDIYIAMEFVDGITLAEWQKQPERTWEERLRMYIAAGNGLHAAHEAGLVHRDFKPENVLVGSEGRPRVADFGLAHGRSGASDEVQPVAMPQAAQDAASSSGALLVSPITQAGALLGTPLYMSPEQLGGESVGPLSDQYSFCVALYEALYGVTPFDASGFEALRGKVLFGKVKPPPLGTPVPKDIQEAIARGMSRNKEDRFASMAELLSALSFATENPAVQVSSSRRWFSACVIGLSILLVTLFLGPTLRNQNTVGMAMTSAVTLFVGLLVATLLLRGTLLRNPFHRGIVILILCMAGQEALISSVGWLLGMNVAQIVSTELTALAGLIASLSYFFFRRAWLLLPLTLLGMAYVAYSPLDAGLVAMLLHGLCGGVAIFLWSDSGNRRTKQPTELPSTLTRTPTR